MDASRHHHEILFKKSEKCAINQYVHAAGQFYNIY